MEMQVSHTGAPFSDLDKSNASGTGSLSLSGRPKRKPSNHMKAIKRANTQPLEGGSVAGQSAPHLKGMNEMGSPRAQPMIQTSSWPPPPKAPGNEKDLLAGSGSPASDTPQRRRTSLWAKPAPGEMTHRVPGSQYFILAVWMSLLFVLYLWSRFLCTCGIPSDCAEHDDIVIAMRDIQFLMYSGFVLAVMTGMHWPDRFEYVFAFGRGQPPRGPAFVVMVFFTCFFWGVLDYVPGFSDFSLSARAFEGFNILILLLLSLFAGGLVIWHILHAFRNNSGPGFAAYVASRAVFACFYATYGFVAAGDLNVNFHFHHYMFAYLGALLAEFNHPVSVALLGVGTAIYVQGIAAYEADGIITHKEFQLHFDSSGLMSPPVTQEAADFFLGHCSEWRGNVTLVQ